MSQTTKNWLVGAIVFALGMLPVLTLLTPTVTAQGPPESVLEKKAAAAERAEERKTSVEERKAEIREAVEQRKLEIQQEVCERKEATIQRVIPRLANGANAVKAAMDSLYERVVGFYENGPLTVEDVDSYLEAIEEAKANAETAIQATVDYEFEFDCENPSVGQQLDGFRDAVSDAREELKAYRAALVDFISDLRAEAADDSENEESEDELEDEVEDENEEEVEDESEDEVEDETDEELNDV